MTITTSRINEIAIFLEVSETPFEVSHNGGYSIIVRPSEDEYLTVHYLEYKDFYVVYSNKVNDGLTSFLQDADATKIALILEAFYRRPSESGVKRTQTVYLEFTDGSSSRHEDVAAVKQDFEDNSLCLKFGDKSGTLSGQSMYYILNKVSDIKII